MPGLPSIFSKGISYISRASRYRTPREIIVSDVPTAALYRALQLVIFATMINALVEKNTWAYSEAPDATVNIWAEPTESYTAKLQADYSTLPYCSSPNYAYYYSDNFVYKAPECRAMAVEQIVRKLDGVVYIMTQFQESFEVGWPCSQTGDTDLTTCNDNLFDAAHTAQPLIERAGGQCVCTSSTKTIFPVGVESLAVKFEHSFKTKQTFSDVWSGGLGDGSTVRGSSSSKPCSLAAKGESCDSDSNLIAQVVQNYSGGNIINPKTGTTTFPLGQEISMMVSEWLDVAGPSGKCSDTAWCDNNRTLDFPNDKLKKDSTGSHPYVRLTGVAVNMELRYSNLNDNGKAELYNENVRAEVRSEVELGAWAGLGGESEYVEAPVSDDKGRTTYRRVRRYGQGLIFRMHPGGSLYVFEIMYLINVLVAGAFGLAAVNILMDFVVKHLLPGGAATLMNAKKCEIVSKAKEDRELGMKAALAAAAFASFDPDKNGVVEMEDIARVFGRIKTDGLDAEKAHSIAWRILHETGDDLKFGASEHLEAKRPALSFASFVDLTSEAGFSFEHYVKHLRDAKKVVHARKRFTTESTQDSRSPTIDAYFAESLKTCTAAFDDVQKKGRLRSGSGNSQLWI